MSETIEQDGYWWLPGRDDTKVPGHFRFDDEGGGRLALIGSLNRRTVQSGIHLSGDGSAAHGLASDLEEESGIYPIIFGELKGKPITLIDSFQTHIEHGASSASGAAESILVNRAFVGAWFDAVDLPACDGISVTMSYLDDWALEQWIDETQVFRDEEVRTWNGVELRAAPLEPRTTVLADGTEIVLGHRVGYGGRRSTQRHIWQAYHLRINTPDVRPVDDLIDLASDFQDLVSIATGRNAAFKKVVGWRPTSGRQRPDDDTDLPRQPFDIIARWMASDSHKKPDQIDSHEMLFSMDDLGGIVGVGRWMNAAATHRSTLGRTMAARASDGMYLSDRLLNYAAALEGFDRRKTGSTRPKLPARLHRLVKQAGQPFTTLVGKPNRWVDTLVWHRNDIAHHLGRQSRGSATDEHYLAESAYWLTVFLMLREADAPEAVFTRMLASREFAHLMPKIQGVIVAFSRLPRT